MFKPLKHQLDSLINPYKESIAKFSKEGPDSFNIIESYTGSGKTTVFGTNLISLFNDDFKNKSKSKFKFVLFLTPRADAKPVIKDSTVKKHSKNNCFILDGNEKMLSYDNAINIHDELEREYDWLEEDEQCTFYIFATYQWFFNKLRVGFRRFLNQNDSFIIFDECHIGLSVTSGKQTVGSSGHVSNDPTWFPTVINELKNVHKIGISGTPTNVQVRFENLPESIKNLFDNYDPVTYFVKANIPTPSHELPTAFNDKEKQIYLYETTELPFTRRDTLHTSKDMMSALLEKVVVDTIQKNIKQKEMETILRGFLEPRDLYITFKPTTSTIINCESNTKCDYHRCTIDNVKHELKRILRKKAVSRSKKIIGYYDSGYYVESLRGVPEKVNEEIFMSLLDSGVIEYFLCVEKGTVGTDMPTLKTILSFRPRKQVLNSYEDEEDDDLCTSAPAGALQAFGRIIRVFCGIDVSKYSKLITQENNPYDPNNWRRFIDEIILNGYTGLYKEDIINSLLAYMGYCNTISNCYFPNSPTNRDAFKDSSFVSYECL